MPIAFALTVGCLFALALYALMRSRLVDHVFGLILLSHAANLVVFSAAGLRQNAAPILGGQAASELTDPLPQALVLTAIVIGFGITAFATMLVSRLHSVHGADDVRLLEGVDHDD